MATNDFLAFAADPAADVMTQSAYSDVGFTPRILGFATGTALTQEVNKVWRQASMMAAMIGQFAVDETGLDMLDDGTTSGQATLLANFKNAVHVAGGAGLSGNYLPLAGGTLSGTLNINAGTVQLYITATTGQEAAVVLNRNPGHTVELLAESNGVARWLTQLANADPETGNNLGSNFLISRYNDAGTYIDTPLSISRQTGVVNFSQPPTVGGGFLPYVPISGGRMTGYLDSPGIRYNYGSYGHSHQLYWDGTWTWSIVDGSAVYAIASVNWVQNVAAGYLPLSGGILQGPGNLDIEGSLAVSGPIWCRSSVVFANLGDFANFTGSGWRYRQWAGNWYDAWNGANGTRLWAAGGGTSMQLDYSANFYVSGNVQSGSGRIISVNDDNNASITCYNHARSVAWGFWAGAADGMYEGGMDGAGNPVSTHNLFRSDGVFTNWNGINSYGSIQAWQQVTAGGRFYGTDRLLIASNYPTIVAWNVSLGWAAGFIATSYGPNQYGTMAIDFGGSDGSGNIYSYLMTLTNYGWLAVSGGIGGLSDRRAKENIEETRFDSLAAISRINQHSFDMQGVHIPVGMIADEVERQLPSITFPGPNEMACLDLMALVSHAFRAIAQLAAEVTALKGARHA